MSQSPHAFLNVPGEIAELMRDMDWSLTPFGPVETWSTALKSAVSIALGSRFPMVLYWGETRALIYNDAWAPILGQKHPWGLGRAGTEVWAEIWDIIGPMFDQVMEQGEATWSDDQLLPLNRFGYVEECYFYYSYSPVRGEDGAVEGIFTAVTETTQRVLTERRERLLREISEAGSQFNTPAEACEAAVSKLASIPEEAPFAIAYLVDAETGDLVRSSLHGLTDATLAPARLAEQNDATPWGLFSPAAKISTHIAEDLHAYRDMLPSTPWPEPVEQAIVTPILSAKASEPYGFLISGASSRRRVDAAYITLIERTAAHITTAIANADAYAEEKRRAEQLAELDRAKTAFFSNASHEFRTPLTLMLGPIEEMVGRLGTRDAVEVSSSDLALVQRNGQRLLRLVNTLLDFSRIEAGRARADLRPTDLAAYTVELASSFQSAMERAGLEFRVECSTLPGPVAVDRDMWEKIVLNLISNAFKYTLGGSVVVSLRSEGKDAVLRVTDTGVGIPADELDRVFERFHRIEGQEGRTHEGTGIGLALVKDLVQLHEGHVSVASENGEGSSFIVRIPLDLKASEPASGVELPVLAPTAVKASTFVAEALRWLPDATVEAAPDTFPYAGQVAQAHVLLADDSADMRGYVERLLVEAGYQVTAVGDGVAAAEAAEAGHFDLVLSDVMMPRLDGFGLVSRLRAHHKTSEWPIILLSARAGEEESIEGLAAGADDYLVKPFSARELIARVEGVLRLSKVRSETSDKLREANDVLEERVEQRTRELDRAWSLARDLVGIADSDGIWKAVNPSWTRTLGWTADEIVGRTSEWLEHPDDRLKTRAEVERLASGNVTLEFENRFLTKEGGYRTLSWTGVPEGDLIYCVARDVTEERERAAELEIAKDLLRQSQKMEAVGQLTGGIAHDFNNLLQGITGSLEMLDKRIAQNRYDNVHRYVSAARGAAQRAASLTQRLLAFSRRQTLDARPLDVNHLLGNLEDLICRSVGPSIEVRFEKAEELWTTCIDANQLDNAILNLCINARDAMPDGGKLTIQTDNVTLDNAAAKDLDMQSGSYVMICVSDTGTGMSTETLDRAFDPFYTTKPLGQGTGLGLSMIYGFVRQSHGYIKIDSELGEGTRMCVYFQRHEGSLEDENAYEISSRTPPEASGSDVLIVDDEPIIRMLVSEVLVDTGHRFLEAEDGPSALSILQSSAKIDLLITDVGLPGGMNGRQLADAARVMRPDLKVLFITGYAESAAVRSGLVEPGMAVLTKPFSVEQLSVKVVEIMGET